MEEESNYWTVGRYCNYPETLEHAKFRAEQEARNEGGKIYLYKIVGVVEVVEKVQKVAEWSNTAPPNESATAPSAPVADEPVIADAKNIAVDDDVLWHISGAFVPAKISLVFRDGSFRLILPGGQWVNADRDSLSHAEVRPAVAPAFKFGQWVRLTGKSHSGNEYSSNGIVVNPVADSDGEITILLENFGRVYYKPDQVFPL